MKLLLNSEILNELQTHHNGHASLAGVDLSYRDLTSQNFLKAHLCGASLFCADCRGSVFAGACMRGVDASLADFTNSDLRSVDFRGARLLGANFSDANLNDADFAGADITGAKFERSRNITLALSRTVPYPEEGEFLAFAKTWAIQCEWGTHLKAVMKLEVPSLGAKGFGGRSFKVKNATLVDIEDSEGNVLSDAICSSDINHIDFKWRVGDSIDVERAFLTRAEAAGRSKRRGR